MNSTALINILKRLGGPGLLGLALLGGAFWVERQWVPQQQAQAEKIESDARRLRHDLQVKAEEATKAHASGADQHPELASPKEAWATLWLGLPDAGRRVELQKGVLLAARDAGLSISAVQYNGQFESWLDKSASQGLWRQHMTMPVEGSYKAIKSWLDRLLAEPALSIDTLDIQRSDVMSDRVKAQVAVSLWWRQERGR